MEFAVSLPEDGDVDGMQQMLDDNPEHKDELLFGERDGVSDGNYSAWSYSTWLCHFEKYRENARRVVKWLIKKGRRRDLWLSLIHI